MREIAQACKKAISLEELYYRINVFTIHISPLRERKSDIPFLVEHFVRKYGLAMGKPVEGLTPEALDRLMRHTWPGNLRELENAVERAMVVGRPPHLRLQDFSLHFDNGQHRPEGDSLEEVELAHIRHVLEQQGWNITRTAEVLGINRVTLYNKIKRYGLRKE